MIKLKDILLELTYDLSNAYKDIKLKSSSKDYVYEFTTDKGTVYNVIFSRDPKDHGQYERTYWPVNKDAEMINKRGLTGEGDALRVNATVMEVTLKFLSEVKEFTVLLIRPISSGRMTIVKKLIDENLPDKFAWEEVNDDILIYERP
jgi:hypothetical protein